MEMSIKSIKANEVELSIKDEDISILYILQHELLKDESVRFAGFTLKHPLTLEYDFRIVADDPLDALNKAIDNAISNVKVLDSILKVEQG